MRVVIAAGFAVTLAGCSVGSQVAAPQTAEVARDHSAQPALTEAPGPVIVTLQSQKGRVTVYASDVGPLFTITGSDGAVEAERLSFVELQDRYPDYYQALRNSIAEDGRMYAGYDRPAAEREPDARVIRVKVLDEGATPGNTVEAYDVR